MGITFFLTIKMIKEQIQKYQNNVKKKWKNEKICKICGKN